MLERVSEGHAALRVTSRLRRLVRPQVRIWDDRPDYAGGRQDAVALTEEGHRLVEEEVVEEVLRENVMKRAVVERQCITPGVEPRLEVRFAIRIVAGRDEPLSPKHPLECEPRYLRQPVPAQEIRQIVGARVHIVPEVHPRSI